MKIKRFNLGIPDDLYKELERIAKRHETTETEMIRKAIRLAILILDLYARKGHIELIEPNGDRRAVEIL